MRSRSFHPDNSRRFATLLAGLVLLVLGFPLADRAPILGIPPYRALFTLVMIFGLFAVSRRRARLWIGLALLLPGVVTEWSFVYRNVDALEGLIASLQLVFLVFVTAMILLELLGEPEVSIDTILGGVCVYLLIGTVFAVLYMAMEGIAPGSFELGGTPVAELATRRGDTARMGELVYFSFVTLTTLGYGDVVPVGYMARSLALFEAVAGSLFIAIFIAGLVGAHLSQSARHADRG